MFYAVFKGGMEVDLAACMRIESDTEDISMFPDMNLPSNIDKQATNLSHGKTEFTACNE